MAFRARKVFGTFESGIRGPFLESPESDQQLFAGTFILNLDITVN